MCSFKIKNTHTETVLWVTYSLYAIVLKTGSGCGMFLPLLVGALYWLACFHAGQTLQ